MAAEERVEVAVVGGGIAGLSVGLGLARRGVPFALLEASNRWGGCIRTEERGGFILDGGPDCFLAQKPQALETCREVGLAGRLVPSGEPRTVYVLRHGKLHPLPPGMAMGAPSDVPAFLRSRLFTWRGKVRMALERLVPARRDGADESIATFFRRRFGAEALELLGEPLLAGIHAGDAESLSLRSAMPRLAELERQFGSLSRGMGVSRGRATGPPAPPFYALRGGMMELVRALVERLPASSLRPGCAARALRRRGGEYELETEGGGRILARSVVLALPPPFAQLLLSGLAPQAACMLSLTPVASTATVLLGYRRQDVAHPLDGHGLLVPRSEGLRTTACSFVSSKFAFRAPEGHVLLRAFVGGVRDPGAVSLPAEAALSMVQAELGPLLGIRGLPLVSRVYPWPAAMPQMEVGHATRLAALEESLADFPGLFLTGAGLRGTGIPDGIADGLGTAVQAAGFVEARHAA